MYALRLDPALVLAGSASTASPDNHVLPLYLSPVAAGWPSPADDYVDRQINLHELLVRNSPATFFLRASGESMIGVGIHDGDLLIVDRSVEATPGRIVIAALDGELLVKRLERHKDRVLLVPANPDYPVIDVTDREHMHIWGVVVHAVHDL